MKDWKMLAALPLLAGGLWAAPLTGGDPVLPEKVFPALDDILKTAVHQSPRMLDEALGLEMAENDRITARAGLLPSASAFYDGYESRDRRADVVGDLNVRKVYYSASVVQPLYFWGERSNNARAGKIRQKIAQGQYQDAYRLFAQDLRGKYLNLITLKVTVDRARFNRQFTQELLRLAEDRLAKKIISDLDIFPTRLNAERADIDLEHATFDLDSARQTIARLAGVPAFDDDSIPEAVPPLAYSPDVFDRLLAAYAGEKDLPTVEAATMREQIEVQKLDYLTQKTRLRPKFSLAAGISQDEQAYTIDTAAKYQLNSVYGGFQVSWTIFDGFASQAAVRSSLARRRQMENDYKDLTERLIQQARSQVKLIYFAARTMSIDDRFLTSSEGNLHTRQDEFTRGVISESDVSLAQLSLFDSRISAYNARIDFLVKVGDFLGTLNDDPVVANAPVN